MLLFCDTSALVKLFVDEAGSDQVLEAWARAEQVAVSRLAWVEAMSAFARRARERPADEAALDQARQRLRAAWANLVVVNLDQSLAEQAGDYADAFGLRAYDSVQLASAQLLHRELGGVCFACFDSRLNKAAGALGMRLL